MLLKKGQLVLCLVNEVTINQCANLILASGAKPVMSRDNADAQALLKLAKTVYLNTGTINAVQRQTMLTIAREARNQQIPVVLDPVGAGASNIRTQTAQEIIALNPTVIRGNAAEVHALVDENAFTVGVDAKITESQLKWADDLHQASQATILMTGAEDYVVSQNTKQIVSGGNSQMELLTGTGCMLSALVAALLTELPPVEAAVRAASLFKEIGKTLVARELPTYNEIYNHVYQAQ